MVIPNPLVCQAASGGAASGGQTLVFAVYMEMLQAAKVCYDHACFRVRNQDNRMTQGLLQGKRFLVAGIASKLSIAYAIAQALHREGAELAFTYPNEKLKKRVDEFAAQFGSTLVFECDVAEDAHIEKAFADLALHWDGLDGVVHSIGFAPADQLDGDFTDVTSRERDEQTLTAPDQFAQCQQAHQPRQPRVHGTAFDECTANQCCQVTMRQVVQVGAHPTHGDLACLRAERRQRDGDRDERDRV